MDLHNMYVCHPEVTARMFNPRVTQGPCDIRISFSPAETIGSLLTSLQFNQNKIPSLVWQGKFPIKYTHGKMHMGELGTHTIYKPMSTKVLKRSLGRMGYCFATAAELVTYMAFAFLRDNRTIVALGDYESVDGHPTSISCRTEKDMVVVELVRTFPVIWPIGTVFMTMRL